MYLERPSMRNPGDHRIQSFMRYLVENSMELEWEGVIDATTRPSVDTTWLWLCRDKTSTVGVGRAGGYYSYAVTHLTGNIRCWHDFVDDDDDNTDDL